MTRRVSALLCAALFVSAVIAGPVAARCDPGRATSAQNSNYGAKMAAGSGVKFHAVSGNIENDDIPYIEGGGTTTTWMRLGHTPNGQNPNAIAMVGLRWSQNQGLSSSTAVVVYITDEEGDAILWNNIIGTLADFGGSDTNPRIGIAQGDWLTNGGEEYQVSVNSELAFVLNDTHGAEGFKTAEVYSQKGNVGSQVPGESTDTRIATNILYTTQYGTAAWGPTGGLINTGTHGAIGTATGYMWTYDISC